MKHEDKTKEELVQELVKLRQRIAQLERSEIQPHQLPTVMETGNQLGMRTMDQALKELVDRDMVSYETAVVRVRNRTVFEKSLMYHS